MAEDKRIEQMQRIKDLTEAILKVIKASRNECTFLEIDVALKRVRQEVQGW